MLRARQALIDGALRPAAVVVERGVIRSIEPLDAVLSGLPSVDLGDAVLLPGVVDAHVHINDDIAGNTHIRDHRKRLAIHSAAADFCINRYVIHSHAHGFISQRVCQNASRQFAMTLFVFFP